MPASGVRANRGRSPLKGGVPFPFPGLDFGEAGQEVSELVDPVQKGLAASNTGVTRS